MTNDEILRFPVVEQATGLSRTTIWRKERDGTFPARRKLSTNTVGWLRSEIDEWIAERMPVSVQNSLHTPVQLTGQGGAK